MSTAGHLVGMGFAPSALGFVGLIGGKDVVSAMTMTPFYPARRWLGWYNTPSSLDVARHLANFADSSSTRPYGNHPTALRPFDRVGPRFISAFSRRETQSGHLGYLTAKRCSKVAHEKIQEVAEGDSATVLSVTLLDLQEVDFDRPFQPLSSTQTLLSLLPIATSIAACTACASISDWCLFAVLLVGIFTSGLASIVIGSGRLTLESVKSLPPEAPPGRGMLVSGETVVVLRGNKLAVDAIKKGKFNLRGGKHWLGALRVCSLLYIVEFLVQVIFIPQGMTFGLMAFIVSLSVSWMCNHHFSSLQEELQTDSLFTKLGRPEIRGFRVGTRTVTAVFVCLLLFHDVHRLASSNEYNRILTTLLPDATPVWRSWKDRVIEQLQNVNDTSLSHLEVNGEDDEHLSEVDKKFLLSILEDAAMAFHEYFHLCTTLPYVSLKEH